MSDDCQNKLWDSVMLYAAAIGEYRAWVRLANALPESEQSTLFEVLQCSSSHTSLPINLEEIVTRDPQQYLTSAQELQAVSKAANQLLIGHARQIEDTLHQRKLDGRTSLYNSSTLYEKFRDLFLDITLSGGGKKLGVLFIDLNDFKWVNDHYGHETGNRVLSSVGNVIRSSIRQRRDIPIRFGGDEIVVYAPVDSLEGARKLSNHLSSKLESTPAILQQNGESIEYIQTASIGYTLVTCSEGLSDGIREIYAEATRNRNLHPGDSAEIMQGRDEKINNLLKPIYEKAIHQADQAVFDAKARGKREPQPYYAQFEKKGYYHFSKKILERVRTRRTEPPQAIKLLDLYISRYIAPHPG